MNTVQQLLCCLDPCNMVPQKNNYQRSNQGRYIHELEADQMLAFMT